MSTIARKIVAAPVRTASETWAIITDLLSKSGSSGRTELASVSGTASSLIADECFRDSPAIVAGCGPILRIYCLFDDDAIDQAKANEGPLSFDATDGDWQMSLPCHKDDLEWVRKNLAAKSKRITAHDMDKTDGALSEDRSPDKRSLKINVEGFLNI